MAEIALLDFNDGHANLGVGELEGASSAHGHVVVRIDVRGGEPLPERYGAVLTSGGPGSPLQDGPWTEPLLNWLRRALEQGQPILAICFGFQMLVRAVGGRLSERERSRFGIYDLNATVLGAKDPWLAAAVPSTVFLQHRWAVESLPGEILARGGDGDIVAARFGAASVGCMFHPEASPGSAEKWFCESHVQTKLDARLGQEGRVAMASRIPSLEKSNRALLHGFLSCLN